MEEFPSGQRGQTVNLLRFASVVRIHPPPPSRSKVRFAPTFFKNQSALTPPRLLANRTRCAGLRFSFPPLDLGACLWLRRGTLPPLGERAGQPSTGAAVHKFSPPCGKIGPPAAVWRRGVCESGPYNRTYVRVHSTMIPPISPDVKGAWGKNTNTVQKTGQVNRTDKSVRPG